jgi:2-methylcitrate dehydratase PrpD
VDGYVTFESSHNEDYMQDPRVMAVRARVELIGDAEIERSLPARQGNVELTMKDGRRLFNHTTAVRGTATNPMTRDEVDQKAYHLLAPILGEARARSLCDAVWTLEDTQDMRSLRPVLQA